MNIQGSDSVQQNKKNIKEKIYPFINEIVDLFYTDDCNSIIEKVIENDNDKSVFLMFIMMYFGIHLKLDKSNDDIKKDQIKILMTELIKDPYKRQFCIEMFENKFQDFFKTTPHLALDETTNNITIQQRLFLKNKEDELNKK